MFLHKITADKNYWYRHKSDYLRNGYFIHQQIWNLVRQEQQKSRNFLFHIDYDAYKNVKHILLLSPNNLQATSKFLIESIEYNPLLSQGDKLRFKLRANPIIKRKIDNKQKEFNVVIDEIENYKKREIDYLQLFSLDELIYDVGIKWLMRKGEQHGFTINYEQKHEITFQHPKVIIGNGLEYQIKSETKPEFLIRTLDFEGQLIITDIDKFKTALYQGIGSAKSFGCGLILIKRA